MLRTLLFVFKNLNSSGSSNALILSLIAFSYEVDVEYVFRCWGIFRNAVPQFHHLGVIFQELRMEGGT